MTVEFYLIFGKWCWDMGFNLNRARETAEKQKGKFIPLDLNEGEVQAIFDRCLAKPGTPKEKSTDSILFPILTGYRAELGRIETFDKDAILANVKNILYLYGQLKNTHTENECLHIEDAWNTYRDTQWANDKGILLILLYLGCTNETNCIVPFDAKTNSTYLNFYRVKPTLSPKDPAFPEWWEQHRAEWEQ